MSNADEFVAAYDRIDQHLRRLTGLERDHSFSAVVVEAGKRLRSVSSFQVDLLEYAQLRNAIVHDKRNGEVIAEPHEDAVRDIQKIAAMITDPPKVIPLFAGRVESIPVSASIGDAVQMMHQKGYSQIPTYRGETFVGLLTANTIARWLGSSVQDELVSLAETSVERVLTFAEDSDNFRFTSRGGSIFDVIGIFESYLLGGKRLEAILITHAGKPSETPLGIITIWDLPKIYEQVGIAPR